MTSEVTGSVDVCIAHLSPSGVQGIFLFPSSSTLIQALLQIKRSLMQDSCHPYINVMFHVLLLYYNNHSRNISQHLQKVWAVVPPLYPVV